MRRKETGRTTRKYRVYDYEKILDEIWNEHNYDHAGTGRVAYSSVGQNFQWLRKKSTFEIDDCQSCFRFTIERLIYSSAFQQLNG